MIAEKRHIGAIDVFLPIQYVMSLHFNIKTQSKTNSILDKC